MTLVGEKKKMKEAKERKNNRKVQNLPLYSLDFWPGCQQ